MPDTLHSVARRMAAAGRLPGIVLSQFGDSVWSITPRREASDADLMHAAIQHAMNKEWEFSMSPYASSCLVITNTGDDREFEEPDTTAMSVLLAVEKACNAAEANGGGR